ncbi:sulfatase-like hydrolase/transferase [Chlamydiota bacterium]
MKNILLFVIDCLGYDFIKEEKRKKYSYINSLFTEGVSFSQTIATSTTTTPSVASILTGCYPFRHGIMTLGGNRLFNRVTTLSERLCELGYNTYAEVTGPLYKELGLNRGFMHYNYRDCANYLISEWGEELKNKLISGSFKEPWFIFLHLWELHRPRQILPEFQKMRTSSYEKALFSLDRVLEKTFLNSVDLSNTIVVLTGDHGEQIERTILERKVKTVLKIVCDKVYNYGFLRNLMFHLYMKSCLGHGFGVSEPLVRVPLLFIAKNQLPKKTEINFQVSHVDILPTLLSLISGYTGKLDIDGKTLLPVIQKDISPQEHIAYMQASGVVLPNRSQWLEGIRYKGLKYIKYIYGKNRSDFLYRISDDYDEKENIRNKELRKKMRLKLEELKRNSHRYYENTYMSEDEMLLISEKLKELGYF